MKFSVLMLMKAIQGMPHEEIDELAHKLGSMGSILLNLHGLIFSHGDELTENDLVEIFGGSEQEEDTVVGNLLKDSLVDEEAGFSEDVLTVLVQNVLQDVFKGIAESKYGEHLVVRATERFKLLSIPGVVFFLGDDYYYHGCARVDVDEEDYILVNLNLINDNEEEVADMIEDSPKARALISRVARFSELMDKTEADMPRMLS